MRRPGRLIAITFIESFATICVERSVYFYARKAFAFTDATNLWLALSFGAAYVLGALASHRAADRLKEKPLLAAAIAAQCLVHLVLTAAAAPAVLFVGNAAIGLLNGLKWPVIESYVGAGQSASATAKAIGRFNVAWASAVPLSLALAGPVIGAWPAGLFALAAAMNGVSLWLIRPLTRRPMHIAHDHPDRPPAEHIARLRPQLTAARWLMLASYSGLWILAALMPRIFADLGFRVQAATGLSGLVDLVRLSAFVILGRTQRWHGRAAPLLVALVAIPAGFAMVVSAQSTAVVLAGELVFGLAVGMVYYAALYYAIVVRNAAVDAGGVHESLIGLGFAAGPAAGLIGMALADAVGGPVAGLAAGAGPLMAACAIGALWSLAAGRRRGPAGPEQPT